MLRTTSSSTCQFLQQQDSNLTLSEEHFDIRYWSDKPGFKIPDGGRGGSALILLDGKPAILRRYYRGGLVSRFLTEHYLWLGKHLTRPWREWHILERARQANLPVPEVIAACTCRRGLFYRAAIITALIEHSETLAARLSTSALKYRDWHRLGRLLKRMQAEGIQHTDLNATNILLDAQGRFHLIDFDKARIRNRLDDWQWRPLYRLQRSLDKFKRSGRLYFDGDDWQALMDGYAA